MLCMGEQVRHNSNWTGDGREREGHDYRQNEYAIKGCDFETPGSFWQAWTVLGSSCSITSSPSVPLCYILHLLKLSMV